MKGEQVFWGRGEGAVGAKVHRRVGGCPLQLQRQAGKACSLAPVMSQSSLGWVSQRPLRLVNRGQLWEISQWILHCPACPKPPRAEAKGPASWGRGRVFAQGVIHQLTCDLEPASSAKWAAPAAPCLRPGGQGEVSQPWPVFLREIKARTTVLGQALAPWHR